MEGRCGGPGNGAQEILLGFQAVFLFLGEAYLEPPESGWLDSLPLGEIVNGWPTADHPDTRQGLHLLEAYLRCPATFPVLRLQRDYARLFIGPGSMLAPPYESVYRSESGILFEKCTLDVRSFYLEFDLETDGTNVRPDDHVGLELQFMSYLCEMGLSRLEDHDQRGCQETFSSLKRFFSVHIGLWAPSFCGRVVEYAETDFYRAIAFLTLGTLKSLQDLFVSSDFK